MSPVAPTPKPAHYIQSSGRSFTDSSEGLRRVPSRWPHAARGPTLEISSRTRTVVRVRCPRDVLPSGRPPPRPLSTPKLLSVLPTMALGLSLQTPSPELRPRFNTPERSRELRLCPPRRGPGPVPPGPMLRASAPWAGSRGVGGVLCPAPARPVLRQGPRLSASPLGHELLLGFHPQPRNREAQYPAGSRSYLQGPPRLSASPPPSCISERLHFSGSQL